VSTPPVTELLERQLEVASLSGEVDSIMRGIVDRLMELDGADGASLSTIEGELAHFKVSLGQDAPLHGRTLPLADTLGDACIDESEPVVLRASAGRDVARCLTPGAGAIVLTRIAYDGRTAGILGVRSSDGDAFDESAVDAVRMLARSAAVALRNGELVERLAASERRYRVLHDQAADATIVSDSDGNVLDANDAAAALLWYSTDALRAMNMSAISAPADLADRHAVLDALLQRRELRGERRLTRKDGAMIEVEYSSRALQDGRIHTTLRDISQRKRNEDRLRTNLERLHEIVETQREISALELDADAITATITARAQRLAGADGAGVQWFDGSDSIYRFASGFAAPCVGLRIDRDASISGWAARERTAVYSPDAPNDPRADQSALAEIGVRSLICAPLYRDEEVVGALSVMSVAANAFDELDVETTRLMAEFVSTAFRNSAELDARRRLVEELRSQGQVVEHMQTGLWIWCRDAAGFVLEHANQGSEVATTVAAAEIVGKRLEDVVPNADEGLVQRLDQVIAEQRLIDWGELEYADERIPSSVFALKGLPLSGNRVAVTFENVTDRVRSRRALQESEARFRGAFGSASVGMALTTLDGRFVQVNDRLAEMLGYDPDELMAKNVLEVSHPDDAGRDVEYAAEMRRGERSEWEHEKRYLRKDGSVVWAHASSALVQAYDGAPSHVVSLVQDITKRREAESIFTAIFERSVVPMMIADDSRTVVDLNDGALELVGVTADEAIGMRIDDLIPDDGAPALWPPFLELGTLDAEVTMHRPDGGKRRIAFVATANVRPGRHIAVLRDLSRQKDLESQLRQAQKMEAVGRLAGGIAHDFNNLLTAISGYSEFLASGIEDPRLRRHAEEIKKAAARAASLTGQLLAFSRRQVLQPRVLDLNAVVCDMDSLLRRLIGEDVELVTMLDPDLGSMQADPTQIEQVIVNLAVNARDAMPHGGSVTIETANVETGDGAFVELRLTDTGVGMTDDERRQLFDPFFTTKEGGTGLGLATVYGIVEQSGGTIEVDTAPGMGSSFRVWLPRVDSPAEQAAPAPAGAPPAAGSETVLLVEDETVVRQLVAEILEMSGYKVLQAGDGPSALELLRRHPGPVALLVTDVVMPGMSGPEVAQAVTGMRPGTHVLYTSGYTDSAIGHHGVLEPGIAFLQKPFSADELTRKVRALLDEPATVGGA
jgi:PAS domain S-box-containing protein